RPSEGGATRPRSSPARSPISKPAATGRWMPYAGTSPTGSTHILTSSTSSAGGDIGGIGCQDEGMRLAEALAERAEIQRRIEQLRFRITGNARYQEGEEPAEDAAALLAEADAALEELRDLIRRINAT